MLKDTRHSMLFLAILSMGMLAASSCSSRYPIDVCHCLEIRKSNSYQIELVGKRNSVVILSPSVALVKRISPDAAVFSNLKSQELIQDPNGPGHRFWENRSSSTEEGYFLHQCDRAPTLVPLGMDREKAIALALTLVEEGEEDTKAQKDADGKAGEESAGNTAVKPGSPGDGNANAAPPPEK